jgi:large subunit ribosomal protein L15
MRLNEISPAFGSKTAPKRLGRGIGSGLGKTSGKGHKGQKARAGGYHKVGFEGGQMPIQRRLPKFGFTSQAALLREEVRLQDLNQVEGKVITLETLMAAGVVRKNTKTAKIVLKGELSHAVTVKGLAVTAGAKKAIEALGGKVEE